MIINVFLSILNELLYVPPESVAGVVTVVCTRPATDAVAVVNGTPPQLIDPPSAICAKLGWPPAPELDNPVQIMLLGLAG